MTKEACEHFAYLWQSDSEFRGAFQRGEFSDAQLNDTIPSLENPDLQAISSLRGMKDEQTIGLAVNAYIRNRYLDADLRKTKFPHPLEGLPLEEIADLLET